MNMMYKEGKIKKRGNRMAMIINYKLKQCKGLIKGNQRIHKLSAASRAKEMQKTFQKSC